MSQLLTMDRLLVDGLAVSSKAKRGMALVNLAKLGIYPSIVGAAAGDNNGFNAVADLVTQTVDGFDLNNIWSEFQQSVALQNAARSTVVLHVLIDGKLVLKDRVLLTLDEASVASNARQQATRVASRAR